MLLMSGGEGYIDFRVGSTNTGNVFCEYRLESETYRNLNIYH